MHIDFMLINSAEFWMWLESAIFTENLFAFPD